MWSRALRSPPSKTGNALRPQKICLPLSASSPLLQQLLATLLFQGVSNSHKHCQSTAPLGWKQEWLLSTGGTRDADSHWLLQLSSRRRRGRAACGTVVLARHLRPFLGSGRAECTGHCTMVSDGVWGLLNTHRPPWQQLRDRHCSQ